MTASAPIDRERLLIYGAGGHGKVVLDAAIRMGLNIGFVLDDAPKLSEICGIPITGSPEIDLERLQPFRFIVAIGANISRSSVYLRLLRFAEPFNIVHPFSCISPQVRFGSGVAVLAGAIINIGAWIGDNVIINTGASVDHDCNIGSHSHICPGVRLAGNVRIGEKTMLGTGSVVIPGVAVGSSCTIGAGSVVIHDIPDHSVALGVPARVVRSNSSQTDARV